ncbi:MAG: hypothetical protein V4739_12455 [Pseudomonadota bacterium]
MKRHLDRWVRRLIRRQLARTSPPALLRMGEAKLLRSFRRAAQHSAAYRQLLADAGVRPEQIHSVADFRTRCPLLNKGNTFRRFPLSALIATDVAPSAIGSVLTSSGHGGQGHAFGITTRQQGAAAVKAIDLGLDMAFEVDRLRTLLINCLPMGVTFQSNAVCVANVSVREDMACAIAAQSASLFDQIILCGDPLFLKRLCDVSKAQGFDWRRFRMNAIIGEETFPESFRDHLAATFGLQLDDPTQGLIGSSMGVGELGLNLFNETRQTIALRRACRRVPALLAALCGPQAASHPLPTFLAFNPLRTDVEILSLDAAGQGELVVTLLDAHTPVPLPRYQTGDRATLLDATHVQRCWAEHAGASAPLALSLPLIALHGRAKDVLPGGWHVDTFKEALYRHPAHADRLSGAHRLSLGDGSRLRWEVQLGQGVDPCCAAEVAQALHASLPSAPCAPLASSDVHCLAYAAFPYGQSIDYERKFTYWAG